MKDTTKSLLLHRISESLLVILPAAVGLLVAPETEWKFPAQTLCVAVGALVGALVVWAKWTLELNKKLSKEERVFRAKDSGRSICRCTEIGEIMLLSRDQTGTYSDKKRLTCPKCNDSICVHLNNY